MNTSLTLRPLAAFAASSLLLYTAVIATFADEVPSRPSVAPRARRAVSRRCPITRKPALTLDRCSSARCERSL